MVEGAGDDAPLEQPEAFPAALRAAAGVVCGRTLANYRLAYALGFHPWEDLADRPPFTDTLLGLVAGEEDGREPPFGRALDIGTGSAFGPLGWRSAAGR